MLRVLSGKDSWMRYIYELMNLVLCRWQVKELVYCAFDAASTHLYVPGLKLHMKNALGYGATPQEIVEVLEIATLLSLHTAHIAAPIIAELASGSASS